MNEESMRWLKEKLPLIEARVAEKVKASKDGGSYRCAYRVNGRAWDLSPENCCFIGAIIEPEEYKPEMENKGPWGIVVSRRMTDWPDDVATALGELQYIHDRQPIESWNKEFQLWKEKYGLTKEMENNYERDMKIIEQPEAQVTEAESDLLKALEVIVEACDLLTQVPYEFTIAENAARAAIAKAKGESQ